MEIEHGRFPTHRPEDHLLNSLLLPPEYNHSVSGVLQIERSSDRKSRSRSCQQSLPAFLFALSSSASRSSSAFGACLRAHIRSSLPALVAFAAAPCDDIDQIVTAVIVGNLGACSDVLDGAYDTLWPIVWASALAGTNDLRNVRGSFGSFRRSSNGY